MPVSTLYSFWSRVVMPYATLAFAAALLLVLFFPTHSPTTIITALACLLYSIASWIEFLLKPPVECKNPNATIDRISN